MSWITMIIALINLLMGWLNRKQQRGVKLSPAEQKSLNNLLAHVEPLKSLCVQMGCQPEGVPDEEAIRQYQAQEDAEFFQQVGGKQLVTTGPDGRKALTWNFGLVEPADPVGQPKE